jgi:GTP-binding protein HflX
VLAADVIIHVRDISHADSEAQSRDVEQILVEVGVADTPARVIEVWNKLDKLDDDARAALAELPQAGGGPLAVSALTGEGIDRLLLAIEDRLAQGRKTIEIDLDAADGKGLHWLYEHAEVMARQDGDDGRIHLTVRAPPERIERVRRRFAATVGAAALR